MRWLSRPKKDTKMNKAFVREKLCLIVFCGSKPCSPVACPSKAFP
ncbi:hypothetical protein [Vagococcus fluvialis]|nr:hypothetical protein [Vagococcus fluvialis]